MADKIDLVIDMVKDISKDQKEQNTKLSRIENTQNIQRIHIDYLCTEIKRIDKLEKPFIWLKTTGMITLKFLGFMSLLGGVVWVAMRLIGA